MVSVYYLSVESVMIHTHTHTNTHTHTHTHTHPFNGPFSETIRVSRYYTRKVKPAWILLKQRDR